jgi:hypothetical protein
VNVADTVYCWLLRLYPASYRDEFGDEMTSVFRAAQTELTLARASKLSFYRREFFGILSGALRAHFDSLFGPDVPFRRFYMQSQFRFPRSTVFLMCVILAGVMLAIEKAKIVVQMKEGLPLETVAVWHPLFWLYPFAVVLAVVGAVWGILFALHRTGMHRLDRMRAWPDQK